MCFFADIWKRWASLNTSNTAKTGAHKSVSSFKRNRKPIFTSFFLLSSLHNYRLPQSSTGSADSKRLSSAACELIAFIRTHGV